MGANEPTPDDLGLNLKQAAATLGVHYMTAYRYVRQGRLAATRVGTGWRVDPAELARFASQPAGPAVAAEAGPTVDWGERLVEPLVRGDEAAAWRVVEGALAAGHDPSTCYLEVLGGALATVEARAVHGGGGAADGPLATAVATRLVARLGARFRRPGRSRGGVVLGAPSGERHALPLAIVADLLRLEGFDVRELGADVAPAAFAAASSTASRLLVVGVGITRTEHLGAAAEAIAAVRAARPDVPVLVGGQAVLNPEVARLLDAEHWAPDGRAAVAVVEGLARARRARARSSGAHPSP